MDVHARSVACKALRPGTGECWSHTFSGEGYEHELLAWLKKLPGPVRCACESGCTGFWMSRFLKAEGIECEVMAVSTLPRSPKNRRHRDDRRDAGVVLREMCDPASDVSYVWAPDPEVEGARDPARAADTASRMARSAKQRGGMPPVKHGFAWSERTASSNLKKMRAPAWERRARSRGLGDPLPGMAPEANARLKKEYDALKGAGKHTNVAKVAVAGELVRWMWALGLQVQREQATVS